MYYVVQVKTGKEEKTIEAIKKQLGNDIDSFDVFAPYKKSIRRSKGTSKEVIERSNVSHRDTFFGDEFVDGIESN